MPQELHVLRCYSCNFFQVHIVKKCRKWECKICSEKQSIKKVYGRGSGRDCRAHVQQLNKLAALQQENQIATYGSSLQSDFVAEGDFQSIETAALGDVQNDVRLNSSAGSSSKWSVFLDKPEDEDSNEEDNLLQCSESPKQKFGVWQYSDSFQNVGSLLSSGGVVEEIETPAYNRQLTSLRNKQCEQTQENSVSNSNISSFNNISDSWNTYENVQVPKNKWLKYVDKARNFPRDDEIEQLSDNHSPHSKRPKTSVCDESIHFVSSNKWHKYVEVPNFKALNTKYAEVPSLMNKNKSAEPITSDTTQNSKEPDIVTKSEKQKLFRKEITSLNAVSRDTIESFSSSTFSRDYNEGELDDILDI